MHPTAGPCVSSLSVVGSFSIGFTVCHYVDPVTTFNQLDGNRFFMHHTRWKLITFRAARDCGIIFFRARPLTPHRRSAGSFSYFFYLNEILSHSWRFSNLTLKPLSPFLKLPRVFVTFHLICHSISWTTASCSSCDVFIAFKSTHLSFLKRFHTSIGIYHVSGVIGSFFVKSDAQIFQKFQFFWICFKINLVNI